MHTVFNSRFNNILKNWLSPLLKSHGFKKRREVYICEGQALTDLIAIQRSRWNDAQEVQFTLNYGIYVPGVVSTYLNQTEPAKAKIDDCCITARIGMLSELRKDQWWTLRVDDAPEKVDAQIGRELQNQVKHLMIPFLEGFETRDDVVDFLINSRPKVFRFVWPQSEAQCLAYAAILLSILGRQEKCVVTLNAAVEAASNTPIEGVVLALRDQMDKTMMKARKLTMGQAVVEFNEVKGKGANDEPINR